MTLTDRDRKIVIVLAPLVLILAYWFLLFSPKREEAATAKQELATQVERRDVAREQLEQLDAAKANFAADYAELVRLGKAVPTSVDMPSLIVQLQAAARGTDIGFTKVNAGERIAAPAPAAAPPAAPGTGDGSQPAAAGEGVEAVNDATATSTSGSSGEGGVPVGSGAAPATGIDPATGAPTATGLESVPLTFEFKGDFFDLSDFLHRLKRFVDVKGEGVAVKGRLLTVDGFDFTSDTETFPKLTVEMRATAYLTPPTEGPTAGATPGGPAPTPPAPAMTPTAPTPVAPPTATATP